MAETNQPNKKRRLRPTTETLREKAVKAQETAAQPASGGVWRSFWRGVFWPLKLVGRGLAWVSHRPPFKQLGHGLQWFFSLRFMRFLGKLLGIAYIVGSWKELKQVTWPNATQSRQLTTAVIIFSIIFGALIAVVDYGLDKLFKQVILKG